MSIISAEIMKIIDEREIQNQTKKINKDKKEQGGQKL